MGTVRFVDFASSLLVIICTVLMAILGIRGQYSEGILILSIVTAVNIVVIFYSRLWQRDGHLPLLEIGGITLVAMTIYSVKPLVDVIASGFKFTSFSPQQFITDPPAAQDLVPLTLRYLLYEAAFAFSYLSFRKGPISTHILFRQSVKSKLITFCVLGLTFFIGFKVLESLTGVVFDQTYDESLYDSVAAYKALPLLLQQITGKAYSIFYVIKMGIVLCLIAMWKNRWARYALFLWSIELLVSHLLYPRARTGLILIFVSIVILYDNFVRHLTVKTTAIIGALIITFFLVYGIMRGHKTFEEAMDTLSVSTDTDRTGVYADEFNVLYAGTYDFYNLVESGSATAIPWQAALFDLTFLIPRQLLPFEKFDGAQWYYTNYGSFPGFFMYNPICQSLVGFGWVELLLRGFLLGWIFGKIHQWYVRKGGTFWPTLFYLWMTMWGYYTIRGPSLGFLVEILQTFLSLFILVKIAEFILIGRESNLEHIRHLEQTGGAYPGTTESFS